MYPVGHARPSSRDLQRASEGSGCSISLLILIKDQNYYSRIGAEQLLQVLNKQLSLATTGSQVKDNAQSWKNMIIDTLSFTKSIFTVTGKDTGKIAVYLLTLVVCILDNFLINPRCIYGSVGTSRGACEISNAVHLQSEA